MPFFSKNDVIFLKECAPDNALVPESQEQTLVMGTLFCYEFDEWKFFKCNEPPEERYLEGKGYFCFDIDHVL